MTTTGRSHLESSHDRSPFISERRRKLFPLDDHDMDSELGHISPLCSDSENEIVSSISDYDLLGIVQNDRVPGHETPMSNKACSETMSPLKLSPGFYRNTLIRDTPKKYSPSQNLKTPHDTSTKPVLQKEQKTLLEELKSLKRKSSPSSSPEQNKSLKVDYKSSKVRTALFPPEDNTYAPLPTKSFYSKNQETIHERLSSSNRDMHRSNHIKLTIGRHGTKHRKKFGQINNGVGHKIRKPKQRKMSKIVIAKAAKKILETGSVLNDYMQDLKELRNKQNTECRLIENPATIKNSVATTKFVEEPPLIKDLNGVKGMQTTIKLISTPIKRIQTFTQENKENVQNKPQRRSVSPPSPSSPKDTKSRKFFKSSRTKVHSKPETIQEKTKDSLSKIINDKNDSNKFDLPYGKPLEIANDFKQSAIERQDITNKVILENNDFDDDDMEPEANIDNILSVLSDDSPQKHIVNRNEHMEAVECLENNYAMPNSDIFSSLNSTFSENTVENYKPVQYVENSCQVSCDILNSLDVVNQNIIQGSEEISGYQLDTTYQTNFDTTTSCQGIDSGQYYPANTNDDLRAANRECIDDSFDITLPGIENMYTSNTLEPCITSSQVVFDNLLVEDGNQTVINAMESLETNKISNNSNKITLEAYNSVLASENSIQLHQSNVANTILSPISHMCDVTSGLALNSPKRGRKMSPLLNNTSRASKILSFTNCNSADMEEQQQQQKLFPVFYPGAKGALERGEKRERGEVKRSAKKFKGLHEDQMLLDAGQKKFGYTICNECNIVYHMGDPGDEIEHMNYHNASHILRFGGWKNEHLIADYQKNGRIIRVLPTDSKIWLKKVKDLMEFVKRDLGCYEMEYDISGSQVYLYIKNRTIAGCAVATAPKGNGHRMLSSLSGIAMCSEESYPIKCGISHIWVATNFRKQRIATALMDAVKNNFVFGYILTDNDIALTSPTEAGSAFAERYFKTPNYLVYYT